MGLILPLLELLLFHGLVAGCAAWASYTFVIEETSYTRLCSTKNILTVNGRFPGPALVARKGDRVIVDVINKANENITIHWHGVKQPRSPWWDGPEYVTQCPIKPGGRFRYKVIFSTEEGTVWWHAHATWTRATVHGPIIIFPKLGTTYPFPRPYKEVPIVLGEWWKQDITQVYRQLLRTGGPPKVSDALTINGQPGDLYPCSKQGTFSLRVRPGKIYLLRIINASLNTILFFAIAAHKLTVVGIDGSYTKPLTSDYIVIPPGQSIDALLETNQSPNHYYMAARAYSSGQGVEFDNTTTTAIVQYSGTYTPSSPPPLPSLPYYNDTAASVSFTGALRSLASKEHPAMVPLKVETELLSTISINTYPCRSINNSTCQGPNSTRLAASMNNISYTHPSISILQAYYKSMNKVFGVFPSRPPLIFNFMADFLPQQLQTPMRGTKVKLLDYGSTVELVLQGTNLVAGEDHPMHLHGHSFYVVGWGFGNFDRNKDPFQYNLVDPPHQTTALVPKNGWIAIRFCANNPGVWFMHCHLERHLTWGMDTVFITRNGLCPEAQVVPPPADLPPC